MLSAPSTDDGLRTARLMLVPLKPAHAEPLFALLDDWEVVRMLAEVPWPLTVGDVVSYAGLRQQSPARADFVITARTGPVGVCNVKGPGTGNPPRVMPRLGYWIGRRHWGQGYATEAIEALAGYAFRSFGGNRIGAGVFADNPASRRVLEKLGFERAGAYGLACRSRGETVTVEDFRITRARWNERADRR